VDPRACLCPGADVGGGGGGGSEVTAPNNNQIRHKPLYVHNYFMHHGAILPQALMTRGEPELTSPGAKFLVLGLGLLFMGRQDAADATLEVRALKSAFPVASCWQVPPCEEQCI